jgi:hypothetical protein
MGLSIIVVGASNAAEIELCFAELVKKQAGGLVTAQIHFWANAPSKLQAWLSVIKYQQSPEDDSSPKPAA